VRFLYEIPPRAPFSKLGIQQLHLVVILPTKMASIYAIPYNGSSETGCDSLTENCNIYYEVRFQSSPVLVSN
jgi:hypothetical protein